MTSITIDEAIKVFVRGFTFTRSFTFPFIGEQIEVGVWVVRDADRSNGRYRAEEYVCHGREPEAIDAIARKHTRGRYRICAARTMDEDDALLRAGFKALGYRLGTTEPFMAHDLQQIANVEAPAQITRVSTVAEADALAKVARSRQILPEYLDADPAPMRQYIATDNGEIIGWVGSIAASDCAWCSNMFVAAPHRRRGIARALLTRMLQDDRQAGARANVLLASHTGAKLYLAVGYQQIGELLVFNPQ